MTFLNHGSFGCCPRAVLEEQGRLRDRMERQPVQFFVRDLEGLLDDAGATLAAFLGAPPEDLVFVPNATAGINAVLRSLDLRPGDECLVTDHEYNACRNALEAVAQRSGASVRVVSLPFPVSGEDEVLQCLLEAVSKRTKILLIDHVSSQTALVLPIQRLARELEPMGVDLLVDGAHAPGMIPVDLSALGVAYYTGNCHKWLCAPKGSGFLYVRPDRQERIRPLSISHGANSPRTNRSRMRLEFGWTGTCDPSSYLCVPVAIRYLQDLMPGGWEALMQHNREQVLAASKKMQGVFGWTTAGPESMVGSMVSFRLPNATSVETPTSPLYSDPLQEALWARFRVEIPIIPWPCPPHRLLRISAQLYNTPSDYDRLIEALECL